MRIADLLIVLTCSACAGWNTDERRDEPVLTTAEGLSDRGMVAQPRDGGGRVSWDGSPRDFGRLELEGLKPTAPMVLPPGDYIQEVIMVFDVWEGRDDLALGEQSVVTITSGPAGSILHGFVDLTVMGNELYGSGVLMESDPDYDCTTEWMQSIEGEMLQDGVLELEFVEVVAVAGKQCALTDFGSPHLEENRFLVTLTPM